MSVVKYEPAAMVNRIRHDIDKLFHGFDHWPSHFGDEESAIATAQWSPAVDIKEEPNKFVLHADMPGVAPNDIDISMENGVLTIKGTSKNALFS